MKPFASGLIAVFVLMVLTSTAEAQFFRNRGTKVIVDPPGRLNRTVVRQGRNAGNSFVNVNSPFASVNVGGFNRFNSFGNSFVDVRVGGGFNRFHGFNNFAFVPVQTFAFAPVQTVSFFPVQTFSFAPVGRFNSFGTRTVVDVFGGDVFEQDFFGGTSFRGNRFGSSFGGGGFSAFSSVQTSSCFGGF